RLVPRHGPVSGRAECHGGTQCGANDFESDVADCSPRFARGADLLCNCRHRVFRYPWTAGLHGADSSAQHRDLLGDSFGGRPAGLWSGLRAGNYRVGARAVLDVDLSPVDGASGKICHYNGQRLSATANQPGQMEAAGSSILFDLCFHSRAFALRDAAVDQRPPFYAPPSMDSFVRATFDGYLNIWRDSNVVRAVWNTTVLAVVTAVVTIALSVLVSWFVVRRRRESGALAGYLATVSFLPQGVPSIVIGLALIFVYVRFPIPIYGTLWIIALAMTPRYLAFSSPTPTSALIQVHGELEEASQIAGVSWLPTLRKITVALLAPAMINVFFWVAVHAMQELSMALMLYNPSTVVVSTMIWSMWQNGRTADAAVLGVMLTLLSALLLLGGQFLSYLRRNSYR